MKTFKFKTNINCANCVKSVSPFLNEISEIKWSVDTTDPNKILTVETDQTEKLKVISTVEEAGFEIEELKIL